MQTSLPSNQTQPSREKVWTLIGFLSLLAAVYVATYSYVIPRLGQQPISSAASVEFHDVSADGNEHWSKTTLPDGTVRFISPDVVFDAEDFSAFQNLYASRPPQLLLSLSEAGQRHLQTLQRQGTLMPMVCIVDGKTVAEVYSDHWTDSEVAISLNAMSGSDINEVLTGLMK